MSRVVKNSRRCRPRARWKIDAPCMIVLSTSKNAAAVGVGRRSPARPPPRRAAAAAWPASTRPAAAGRAVPGRGGPRADGPRSRPPPWPRRLCRTARGASADAETCAATRPRCGRAPRRPAGEPAPARRRRAGRRRTPAARLTWAEFDAAADAVARGLRAARAGRRATASPLAMANRIELSPPTSASCAAAWSPCRSTRAHDRRARPAARRLRRPGRARATTADVVRQRRRGGPVADEPQVTVVGRRCRPRARRRDVVRRPSRPTRRAGRPPADRRRGARGAALHLRHQRPAAGRDAHPPGAARQHRAVRRARAAAVTADDVVLGVLPLFHVYGLNGVLGQVAAAAGDASCWSTASTPRARSTLIARRGRHQRPGGAPPCSPPGPARTTCASALRRRPAAPVRRRAAVAGRWSETFARASRASTSSRATGSPRRRRSSPSTLGSPRRAKPGSVGRALPGVELRLVDERCATPSADDDPGEIWVRGANLFSGYWPDGADGPDADGWYATGDVGYLDDDGDLFLVDRLQELVIVSAGSTSTRRGRGRRRRARPGSPRSRSSACRDQETGEAVVAFVVVPRPASPTAEIAETVRAHCAAPAGPVQAAAAGRRSSTSCRTPSTGKVAKGRLRASRRETLGTTRARAS